VKKRYETKLGLYLGLSQAILGAKIVPSLHSSLKDTQWK